MPTVLLGSMPGSSLILKYMLMFESSIIPPTMPFLASKFDPPKPSPMYMSLWPLLPMDRRPLDWKPLVVQTTLPITLPIFMWTFSLVKFAANRTSVSQESELPPPPCVFLSFIASVTWPRPAFFELTASLSKLSHSLSLDRGWPLGCCGEPSPLVCCWPALPQLLPLMKVLLLLLSRRLVSLLSLELPDPPAPWQVLSFGSSSSSIISFTVASSPRSPRNNLRTMVRRYQAFGKAKISARRLMSYLKRAVPISMIVENLMTACLEESLTPPGVCLPSLS